MDCGSDNKVFRRLDAIHLLSVGAGYEIVLRNSRVCERMLRLLDFLGFEGCAGD